MHRLTTGRPGAEYSWVCELKQAGNDQKIGDELMNLRLLVVKGFWGLAGGF